MLKIASESHLFGETIVEHGFPHEYDELIDALGGAEVPLRVAEPFTAAGRPATPKRQAKRFGGKRGYALFPVDQAALNLHLHDQLRDRGWNAEPVAAGRPLGTPGRPGAPGRLREGRRLRRGRVRELGEPVPRSLQVPDREPERHGRGGGAHRGHGAAREVLRLGRGDVRAGGRAAALHEDRHPDARVDRSGSSPGSWDPIKERYDRMYSVATENGVACHAFETVFGSILEPQVPGVDARQRDGRRRAGFRGSTQIPETGTTRRSGFSATGFVSASAPPTRSIKPTTSALPIMKARRPSGMPVAVQWSGKPFRRSSSTGVSRRSLPSSVCDHVLEAGRGRAALAGEDRARRACRAARGRRSRPRCRSRCGRSTRSAPRASAPFRYSHVSTLRVGDEERLRHLGGRPRARRRAS